MLTHSVPFGRGVCIKVLVINGYSALDTPARDKLSLRAKTTTIRIRIHRSKRTYSFTFFPNRMTGTDDRMLIFLLLRKRDQVSRRGAPFCQRTLRLRP